MAARGHHQAHFNQLKLPNTWLGALETDRSRHLLKSADVHGLLVAVTTETNCKKTTNLRSRGTSLLCCSGGDVTKRRLKPVCYAFSSSLPRWLPLPRPLGKPYFSLQSQSQSSVRARAFNQLPPLSRQASVVMQKWSHPTETISSNKITRNIIIILRQSQKTIKTEPLGRRPV